MGYQVPQSSREVNIYVETAKDHFKEVKIWPGISAKLQDHEGEECSHANSVCHSVAERHHPVGWPSFKVQGVCNNSSNTW